MCVFVYVLYFYKYLYNYLLSFIFFNKIVVFFITERSNNQNNYQLEMFPS